jgi:hypothetical protein
MDETSADALVGAVSDSLGPKQRELFQLLHAFTAARLETADERGVRVVEAIGQGDTARAQRELHAFLRECWDALDGLGREVNLCMHHLFPDAGLYPPLEMTRQCTFYMVRKKLHEHPDTAEHPVSRLLWDATRGDPDRAYERLSFLYNVSLFVPVPLPEGRLLPGPDDVPEAVSGILKPADLPRCEAREGLRQMRSWVEKMVGRCYAQLAEAIGEEK